MSSATTTTTTDVLHTTTYQLAMNVFFRRNLNSYWVFLSLGIVCAGVFVILLLVAIPGAVVILGEPSIPWAAVRTGVVLPFQLFSDVEC
jgi:hypothetical protein